MIQLNVHVQLPNEVESTIAKAKQQRILAEQSARRAVVESRAAMRQLREMDITLRDIGTTLGISYQCAHQLVNG